MLDELKEYMAKEQRLFGNGLWLLLGRLRVWDA